MQTVASRVEQAEHAVSRVPRLSLGVGFRVSGFGFRVSGVGFRVSGAGFRGGPSRSE